MRLFTATLATETNTFSPMPTSLDSYREGVFLRPGEHPSDAPRMCTAPLFVGRARAKAEGFELIEGSCFAASPAGTTSTGQNRRHARGIASAASPAPQNSTCSKTAKATAKWIIERPDAQHGRGWSN